jgi:hypothetical protein
VLAQHTGDATELGEGVDLPGEAVEPDRRASGLRVARVGPHREQAQVVVVGGALGLQELDAARDGGDDAVPERVGVITVGQNA